MMESIEKLRKWVKSLYTPNSGELKVKGLDIADEIEREIAEKYMELPVDADGVPTHVGDKLTNINKPSDEYIVAGVNEESLFVYGGAGHIHASQCRHVKPRTLEDMIAEYEELSVKQEVKKYFEVSKELREIQREQFREEPERDLYKELHGYEFYIERPYDELWIMTEKVEVKHHSYSYMYKHPNGTTTYSCSSLCGYSREWAIEKLDKVIEEIERELMEVRDD